MKRNYSIDILKTICCFLIIIIHIPWNFKEEILPLTRCAVPCFFMISGFFLYQKDGIDLCKIKHTIKHRLYMTLPTNYGIFTHIYMFCCSYYLSKSIKNGIIYF